MHPCWIFFFLSYWPQNFWVAEYFETYSTKFSQFCSKNTCRRC